MLGLLIVWIIFIHFEQKSNLNHVKNYVKIKIFVMPEDTTILEFGQY